MITVTIQLTDAEARKIGAVRDAYRARNRKGAQTQLVLIVLNGVVDALPYLFELHEEVLYEKVRYTIDSFVDDGSEAVLAPIDRGDAGWTVVPVDELDSAKPFTVDADRNVRPTEGAEGADDG